MLLWAPSYWDWCRPGNQGPTEIEYRQKKREKSWPGFSCQWEEHSWLQSQWRRGRRMAQQDPWPASEQLSPCEQLISLFCHSSYLHRQLVPQARTRFLQCKAQRTLEQLRRSCNNTKQKLQPADGENRALPVSNFVPGKVPCHMKLWATAAAVLSTEKGGLSGAYF